MITVFLLLLAFVAGVYFGYPLFLALVGTLRRRCTTTAEVEALPRVTLLIVAHNEEHVLGAKLENSLALDYPRGRLEIVVASDASTDRTDEIVLSYQHAGIRLVRRPDRGSQTGAQNYAVPRTSGDILVFSDANSMYEPAALRRLVAHFADPDVGCVVGRLRHSNPADSAVSFGEELYWRYEAMLKQAQSRAGALLFANGAIYAVRREAYRPLEGDWDHDTLVPLRCRLGGRRVVYEPGALAFEEAATGVRHELRRKVRIILRDAWTLRDLARPLIAGPAWIGLNIVCHKLLRWSLWLPLSAMLIVSAAGIHHGFMRIALAAQLAFYATAVAARVLERWRPAPAVMRVPLYFCLVNLAACFATVRFLRGHRPTIWTPRAGG